MKKYALDTSQMNFCPFKKTEKSEEEFLQIEKLRFPEVEIYSARDYHMFGNENVSKNTSIYFKVVGFETMWETQYGWIFFENNPENLSVLKIYHGRIQVIKEMQESNRLLFDKISKLSDEIN